MILLTLGVFAGVEKQVLLRSLQVDYFPVSKWNPVGDRGLLRPHIQLSISELIHNF